MKLEEYVNNYMCFYDLQIVNELHEGVLYMEDGDEYKVEDLDMDYFFAYDREELDINWDIRDMVKDINVCKRDLKKFEQGKNFLCFVVSEMEILTDEGLNELFDFDFLETKSNELNLYRYKKINIKS
jgi:ATP-dependent helicase YprA (DUF1998 family)